MKEKKWRLYGGGALTGALNGLFGGGGGMIAVPVLKGAGGLDAHAAHATAIAVILPVSLVSGAVYLLHGFVPLRLLVPVTLGVVGGGVLGARLLPKASSSAVTFFFAALMLVAGIRLVF